MTRDRPGKYYLYHEAVQATWLGLVVNLLLGCAKLAGGLVGQSYALISDAVNSLGDVFTSVAVLLAFRVAQKPADAEHPYGHTRAEAIAGSNVAVLVIVLALLVGWGALQGFSPHAHAVPPLWTLAIAGSNVVIKEALYQYKIRLGRRAGSSAQELMDAQAAGAFVDQIRGAAAAVPGVKRIDKLWVRKSGLEYLVDIHIQVRADQTVDEGHRISHLVKDELLNRFANLRDVLVHLEPYPHIDERGRLYSEET